jgi:hypothetical protein
MTMKLIQFEINPWWVEEDILRARVYVWGNERDRIWT